VQLLTSASLLGSSAFSIAPSSIYKVSSLAASVTSKTTLSSSAFDILSESQVIDPSNGSKMGALDGIVPSPNDFFQKMFGAGNNKTLVVVMQ